MGIQFIVCNNGTSYDEDIDIEIYVPKDLIILHTELDVPNEPLDCDDWSFEDIFEIFACKDFIDYASTKDKVQSYIPVNNHVSLFVNTNYEEGYRETLDEIFDYITYKDGNTVIVKVHMDYLKQHNCAAFPTWIFLKSAEKYPKIKYRITSKNRPDIIYNEMEVVLMHI